MTMNMSDVGIDIGWSVSWWWWFLRLWFWFDENDCGLFGVLQWNPFMAIGKNCRAKYFQYQGFPQCSAHTLISLIYSTILLLCTRIVVRIELGAFSVWVVQVVNGWWKTLHTAQGCADWSWTPREFKMSRQASCNITCPETSGYQGILFDPPSTLAIAINSSGSALPSSSLGSSILATPGRSLRGPEHPSDRLNRTDQNSAYALPSFSPSTQVLQHPLGRTDRDLTAFIYFLFFTPVSSHLNLREIFLRAEGAEFYWWGQDFPSKIKA